MIQDLSEFYRYFGTAECALEKCIEIANKELHNHVYFHNDFVKKVYRLYLVAEAMQRRALEVEHHDDDLPTTQRKKLTLNQFIKKLDYRAQRYLSPNLPEGY